MPAITATRYWLDADDTIIQVCSNWDRFALQNDGDSVLAHQVIGKTLWPFIIGDATRMWLDALLTLARLNRCVVNRPYRCDSPELRRYMEMAVQPEDGGRVCLCHAILRTEPQRHPAVFTAGRRRIFHAMARCSVCSRLCAAERWMECDDWLDATSVHNPMVPVHYTVCPACRQPNAELLHCKDRGNQR